MSADRNLPRPVLGDVVWVRFPYDLLKPAPAPKSRPAIILKVHEPVKPGDPWQVTVCPGTSQNLDRVFPHELPGQKSQQPDEYAQMGLSYDTKFDLRFIAVLEYTDKWFSPPPNPRHGRTPKLGSLHPALMPRLLAAHRAARKIKE
jgi:hypothetical protein